MTEPTGTGPLPHDIMGLQPQPLPWNLVFILLLGLVILAVVFWLVRRLRRKSSRLSEPVPASRPEVRTDPWTRLDQALGAITISDSWTRESCEEFFFRLSFLLREALELRTGLPVTGQTLSETRNSLAKSPALSANFQQELIKFLSLADQLKFAGQWIGDDEAKEWREKVKVWLDELRHGAHP